MFLPQRGMKEVLTMSDEQFKNFWPCCIQDDAVADKIFTRDNASQVRLSGKVLKYKNFIKNYQPKNIKTK